MAVRDGGRPLFMVGFTISVLCANISLPIWCKASRVFSIALVTTIAWKLPPWWTSPDSPSTSGLSVAGKNGILRWFNLKHRQNILELHSCVTADNADKISSTCGPRNWGAVRKG